MSSQLASYVKRVSYNAALMRFPTAFHVRIAASHDDESFLHEAAI